MLSEDSLKNISLIFCGDIEGYYIYKSGPKLVAFFNNEFGYSDVYGQGFPSRWLYVYNKIVDLANKGKLDAFFSLILSTDFIMSEIKSTEVEAVELGDKVFIEFNRILKPNKVILTRREGKCFINKEDDDLVYLGSGGFANVYLQKSSGYVIKKLKEDFLGDKSIRSRFKREYKLMKELDSIDTTINVYDFNEGDCTYTMEKAEQTLEEYVQANELTEDVKFTCIRQILYTMKDIHDKDIIHRDLSPNNIFIIRGLLKIADFGLGKDLNMFASHNTLLTNAVGQFRYCAPEQFMMLRDADKRSDVYSLGRIINFIMTGDSTKTNHCLKSVSEKATSDNAAFRPADAGKLLYYVEKSITYHKGENSRQVMEEKIANNIFDDEMVTYISELSGEELCNQILSKTHFSAILIQYMKEENTYAKDIIQLLNDSYKNIYSFKDYDRIADLSLRIIEDNKFEFVVRELAAQMLAYVAHDVNRFHAQGIVKDLIDKGVEPLIEDIIIK